MVLLQLCRWKSSHKKLCSRLYSNELEFYSQKMTNSLFESPFGGVRGNVRTSSIARWKACGRLPIQLNIVASSYGWDVISRYWSKSAFFKRGWVTLSANFRWKETSPTNLFWYHKTRLITLSCEVKISAVCSFLSSQSTRMTDEWTDRRTDGQNYHPQDHASIAAKTWWYIDLIQS